MLFGSIGTNGSKVAEILDQVVATQIFLECSPLIFWGNGFHFDYIIYNMFQMGWVETTN